MTTHGSKTSLSEFARLFLNRNVGLKLRTVVFLNIKRFLRSLAIFRKRKEQNRFNLLFTLYCHLSWRRCLTSLSLALEGLVWEWSQGRRFPNLSLSMLRVESFYR